MVTRTINVTITGDARNFPCRSWRTRLKRRLSALLRRR
jgi:hypothetical protein